MGGRPFGANTGINKTLSHTFKTESLSNLCTTGCYIPRKGRAWLGVKGASSPANANLFTGDVPNNDIFGTFGAGAMYPTFRTPKIHPSE